MTRADDSPAAVAARLAEALRLGRADAASGLGRGVRSGGEAILARLRQVAELRRLALRLGRRGRALERL